MPRVRLLVLVAVAALAVGVLSAVAGGNDWGTWTHSGSGTTWSGTFRDSHVVTGFDIWTRALHKNPVVSFRIGGHKCKLSSGPKGGHATAYCYYVHIPKNTQLHWKLRVTKPVKGWQAIVPCIQYSHRFHCRYGNG